MKPQLTRPLLRTLAGVVACSAMAQAIDPSMNADMPPSANGMAGIDLLHRAASSQGPITTPGVTRNLTTAYDAVEAYLEQGRFAEADRLAANVAGSGLANLNTAWRGQMERQLNAIRNRVTTMLGGMPCYTPDPKAPIDIPSRYTIWANAELDYQNLSGYNALSGYKLHSLGGTAGIAMPVGQELTVGAAFTGMSGRMSSRGYGSDASGNMNAYYANIFARMDHDCWQHSLIATAGWADIRFNRHVAIPGAAYTTHGSTNGLGLAVMYEVARTYRLSGDSLQSAWWQPVMNVSYIHSQVDGYTEGWSDAGLRVGKQESNNVIFGLGARMQAVVGENLLNTPAIMETRLLGKAITGARHGKAEVSLPGVAGTSSVHGSAPSALGVEIRIGFNIPLGVKCGGIVTDINAEFFGNYRSVNGTLGYRIDF